MSTILTNAEKTARTRANSRQCRSCDQWKALPEFRQRHWECRRCFNDKRIAEGWAVRNARRKTPEGRAARRRSMLKAKYNLTPEDYDNILKHQGGRCAVCGNRVNKGVVDHCHKTGEVRGILHGRCNRYILPVFEHHPDRVEHCFEYLANPPARGVLRSVGTEQ